MTNEFKQKLLSLYSDFDKVLGIYNRKDGRQHLVLNNTMKSNNDKTKLKTISYPKAIMEVKLNRRLQKNETVDHIDKNPLNNNEDNLQVLLRSDHVKLDAKRRKEIKANCCYCNKEIILTRNQLRKDKSGYFCSRKCSGLYGTDVQHNRIKKQIKPEINVEYYCNKDL